VAGRSNKQVGCEILLQPNINGIHRFVFGLAPGAQSGIKVFSTQSSMCRLAIVKRNQAVNGMDFCCLIIHLVIIQNLLMFATQPANRPSDSYH